MALNKLNDQLFTGSDITDITGAEDSLESLGVGAPQFGLLGFNTAASSDLYYSFNGTTSGLKRTLTLHHDFATDGGLIGTVTLRGGSMPDNAVVDNAWYDVTTTYTSATDAATIGLGIITNDATGIQAAAAISAGGDIWDAGLQDSDVDPQTSSTFTTKTTAERTLIMTVAVEDLTAGALVLHTEYRVSEIDITSQ